MADPTFMVIDLAYHDLLIDDEVDLEPPHTFLTYGPFETEDDARVFGELHLQLFGTYKLPVSPT